LQATQPISVILSAVSTSQREVLTESKDRGPLRMSVNFEGHSDGTAEPKFPVISAANVRFLGPLRLRYCFALAND